MFQPFSQCTARVAVNMFKESLNSLFFLVTVGIIGVESFSSCADHKLEFPNATSGFYAIETNVGMVAAYCEMNIAGGGFTFIQKRDLMRLSSNAAIGDVDVSLFFKQKRDVLVFIRMRDRSTRYTVLSQLKEYAEIDIFAGVNTFTNYAKPITTTSSPYLYIGFLPISLAANKNVQGITSNGHRIAFTNCDANPNSYFLFSTADPSQYPQPIHGAGHVVDDWLKTALPSPHYFPDMLFYFTELHFGGCGGLSFSNAWPNNMMDATVGFR